MLLVENAYGLGIGTSCWHVPLWIVTKMEKNGRHFADDIFWCIFVNEEFCILIQISLKFVPKGPIDNNPALL